MKQKEQRTILMWEHKEWGNRITFLDWKKREVTGHLSNPPCVGDMLKCKMQSGKIAVFEFVEVDVMIDPPDQFFAKVSDLHYEGEVGNVKQLYSDKKQSFENKINLQAIVFVIVSIPALIYLAMLFLSLHL